MLEFSDMKPVISGLAILAISWFVKELFLKSIFSDRVYYALNRQFRHIKNSNNATNRLEIRERIKTKGLNSFSDDEIKDIFLILGGQYINNADEARFILNNVFVENKLSEQDIGAFTLLNRDFITLKENNFNYGKKFKKYNPKIQWLISIILWLFFSSVLGLLDVYVLGRLEIGNLIFYFVVFLLAFWFVYRHEIYPELLKLTDNFMTKMNKQGLCYGLDIQ